MRWQIDTDETSGRSRGQRRRRVALVALVVALATGGLLLLRHDEPDTGCGSPGADTFCQDQIVAMCDNAGGIESWTICIRRTDDGDVRLVGPSLHGGGLRLGPNSDLVLDGSRLVRPDGSTIRPVGPDHEAPLSWFGTTGHLVFQGEGEFTVIDVDGAVVDTIPFPFGPEDVDRISTALSHDENSFALAQYVADSTNEIICTKFWIFDRIEGTWRVHETCDYLLGMDQTIGWTADSRQLLASPVRAGESLGRDSGTALIALDTMTGDVEEIVAFDHGYSYLRVSPDGRLAAMRFDNLETPSGLLDPSVAIVEVGSGEVSELVAVGGIQGWGDQMSWSADSRHLLVAGSPAPVLVAIEPDGSISDSEDLDFGYDYVLDAAFAAAG